MRQWGGGRGQLLLLGGNNCLSANFIDLYSIDSWQIYFTKYVIEGIGIISHSQLMSGRKHCTFIRSFKRFDYMKVDNSVFIQSLYQTWWGRFRSFLLAFQGYFFLSV